MTTPTVFITGAARGIGRSIAETFAANGYLVGAYDLPGADFQWAESHQSILPGTLDVTQPQQWREALENFSSQHGNRLDIFINNAGLVHKDMFMDTDDETDAAIVDVNVKGVLYGLRAAHPYLKATPGAQAVNLCSGSAIYGVPTLASYAATKSAVASLTESLDIEWRYDDIRVLSVWPMFIRTQMIDGMENGPFNLLNKTREPSVVAQRIFNITRDKWRKAPIVHFPVSMESHILYSSAQISPAFAVRTVNRWMDTFGSYRRARAERRNP